MPIECAVCSKNIGRFDCYIECRSKCRQYYHIEGADLSNEEFEEMKKAGSSKTWECNTCSSDLTSNRSPELLGGSVALDMDGAGSSNAHSVVCLQENSEQCEEKGKEGKESEVVFCSAQKVKTMKLEISLLKQLIIEKDEKNSILSENNRLLKEKIIYLEAINTKNSGAISQSKAKIPHVPENTTTKLSYSKSELTTQPRETALKIKKSYSNVLNPNTLVNDNTNIMQKQQQQIMDSVINLGNQEKSGVKIQKDEDGWETVERSRNRRRKSKTILGEASDLENSIRAVPRLAYLHVYRLQPNTTASDLDNYIKSKNIVNA